MKKKYLLIIALVIFICIDEVSAQTSIYIAPGSGITISGGETFTVDSMWLVPSGNYTLNNNTLTRSTIITYPGLNPYMSRVYDFASSPDPFSGSIGMRYISADLNGLSEPGLVLYAYDGSSWKRYSNTTVDVGNKTAVTSSISNATLNEFVLGNMSSDLAIEWGPVRAQRQDNTVHIQWTTLQEQNIKYFDVERSIDGITWKVIISGIPARNLSSAQQYEVTDYNYVPAKIFYRISNTEIDGEISYSSVVSVAAINAQAEISLYPNPSSGTFTITGVQSTSIKNIELMNTNGVLIKKWNSVQSTFDVSTLSKGVYIVRMNLADGNSLTKNILLQ